MVKRRLLRAGQLARLLGVSKDLLRYYERIGVLPPPLRASNGYRLYFPQSVDRVRAIRRSLGLGFSLAELSGIFTMRDRGGVPCRSVRALAAEKLRRVEQAIQELRGLRQQLRQILDKWDQLLAKTGKGERARLLESLGEGPLPSNHSAAALKNIIRLATLFGFALSACLAQEKPREEATGMAFCPMHEQAKDSRSDPHHQGVVKRGDEVMGFSHEKTTHHFRLYPDGGAIEAEANDAKDTASSDQIRSHFEHIATMFAAGSFSAPMLIHAQNPPGTETMKRLREAIQYKLETTEKGASIHIITKNAEAVRAVHAFLRFQISDHQTGDTTEITKAP